MQYILRKIQLFLRYNKCTSKPYKLILQPIATQIFALLPFLRREAFEHTFNSQRNPWGLDSSPHQIWKNKLMIKLLPKKRFKSILDVGCTRGQFIIQLSKLSDNVKGIDISKTAIKEARKRYGNKIKFEFSDIVSHKIEGKYDLIICQEVLYYIPYLKMKSVLHKLKDCLENGGYLLLCELIGDVGTTAQRKMLKNILTQKKLKIIKYKNKTFILMLFQK